ncbi:MAG: three-Cys-motif partner protein TcmP [Pseudomonadota bacterium]|nr:three-Cys-motif partner protein TcmP [Pseudomonadota bacterium]
MAVNRGWYEGREQAFVKHSFLDRYLGRLFNKIASSRPAIAYVDGFAGPWKSATERFDDTSFGLALRQLRGAKQQARQPIRAIAHLVEQDPGAFAELQKVRDQFPDIEVVPHLGDFHEVLPAILRAIPSEAFTFSLLDPKGWSIDLARISPLLARPHSEVVINLMYDFINRFIEHPNQRIADSLNRTLPGPDWREAIRSAPIDVPAAREAIIIGTFSDVLKTIGDFRYAPTLRIRRPGHERTLYHLVYGTRNPAGLAVFRESQVKALEAEAAVQSSMKSGKRASKTGMEGLFTAEMEAQLDPATIFLTKEKDAGVRLLLDLLRQSPGGVRWGTLWPQILDHFAVTTSALGREVNRLRKSGELNISDWPSDRKQIPEDDYLLRLSD